MYTLKHLSGIFSPGLHYLDTEMLIHLTTDFRPGFSRLRDEALNKSLSNKKSIKYTGWVLDL